MSAKVDITIDLEGDKVNIRLPWGNPLPLIVYDNKSGLFYQSTKGYSYCRVGGQVLSHIRANTDAEK